jgi:hypothetical protein
LNAAVRSNSVQERGSVTDRRDLLPPSPTDPGHPRYGRSKFPAYRFVPGLNPHPLRDPAGHSYGQAGELAPPWSADTWRELAAYLDAVDLFNYAYWWECHERLEPLWIAAGRTTREAQFVQGLIKVAAACLNKHLGKVSVAARQAGDGIQQLSCASGEDLRYMGLDTFAFALQTRAWFEDRTGTPPLIHLD